MTAQLNICSPKSKAKAKATAVITDLRNLTLPSDLRKDPTSMGQKKMANNGNDSNGNTQKVMAVHVTTFNVRGLSTLSSLKTIKSWFGSQQLSDHLLGLVETKNLNEHLARMVFKGSTMIMAKSPSGRSGGVALFSPSGAFQLEPIFASDCGRLLVSNVSHGTSGLKAMVAVVYAPNVGKDKVQETFFKFLEDTLGRFPIDLVLGDFNTALDLNDRSPFGKADRNAYLLQHIIEKYKYIDGWAWQGQEKNKWTFRRNETLSRIDLVLCKQHRASKIMRIDLRIPPCSLSDHGALTMALAIRNPLTPKGPWRMRTSMIKVMSNDKLKKIIADLGEGTATDKWIRLKEKVGDFYLQKERKLLEGNRKYISKMMNKSLSLIKSLGRASNYWMRSNIAKRLKVVDAEVDASFMKLTVKQQAIDVRAWTLKRQKPTRFLFAKMAPPGRRSEIVSLKNNDGEEFFDTKGKLKVVEEFYSEFFQAEQLDLGVQDDIIAKVLGSSTFKKYMGTIGEGECMLDEVVASIKDSKRGKAPGPDGLPAEWYKHFSAILSPLLEHVFNEAQREVAIPFDRLNKGNIVLLHKKGDSSLASNYRPITLLNNDYKILTTIALGRMQVVFKGIIGRDQHAFLKGRLISDNILEMMLNQALAKQTGGKGYAVFLDQMKAYDRVDHGFLFRLLDTYGVPKNLCSFVKKIYRGATSSINVNGYMSEPVTLSRGVRQGDGLSCLLFVLLMDSYKKYIDAEGLDHPQFVPSHKTTATMFADDTVGVVSNAQGVLAFIKATDKYGTGSGIKLNVPKTEVLPLGNAADDDPLLEGLIIAKGSHLVRHLGIYMGESPTLMQQLEPALLKFRSNIGYHAQHSLQTKGKVLLAWAMLHSVLRYQMAHLAFNNTSLNIFQREINRFIDPRGRIPKYLLMREKDKGGFGAPDLRLTRDLISLQVAKRALQHPELGWVKLLHEHFALCFQTQKGPRPGTVVNLFLQPYLKKADIRNVQPFFRQVWTTWMKYEPEYTAAMKKHCNVMKELPLWGSFMPLGMGRVHIATVQLRAQGISRIRDVLNENDFTV
jgi:hypothetical protein